MIKYQKDNVLVVFGGVVDSIDSLKSQFDNLELKHIKQTHSDIVIEANNKLIEADAHFTSQKKQALLILTADCMPIMIYCAQTGRVAAVHAGWRGVENKIVEKTLLNLLKSGSSKKEFLFWFGPHISENSFKVDEEVFRLISKAHYNLVESEFSVYKNGKYFINLKKIVTSQIHHIIGKNPAIESTDIDTFTCPEYYSYRRDQTVKRNTSFICLLN